MHSTYCFQYFFQNSASRNTENFPCIPQKSITKSTFSNDTISLMPSVPSGCSTLRHCKVSGRLCYGRDRSSPSSLQVRLSPNSALVIRGRQVLCAMSQKRGHTPGKPGWMGSISNRWSPFSCSIERPLNSNRAIAMRQTYPSPY